MEYQEILTNLLLLWLKSTGRHGIVSDSYWTTTTLYKLHLINSYLFNCYPISPLINILCSEYPRTSIRISAYSLSVQWMDYIQLRHWFLNMQQERINAIRLSGTSFTVTQIGIYPGNEFIHDMFFPLFQLSVSVEMCILCFLLFFCIQSLWTKERNVIKNEYYYCMYELYNIFACLKVNGLTKRGDQTGLTESFGKSL